MVQQYTLSAMKRYVTFFKEKSGMLFLTSSGLVANSNKTTSHGGQSRSWSAEQGKDNIVQLGLSAMKRNITLFPVATAVCVQLEYCTLKFPVVQTFICTTYTLDGTYYHTSILILLSYCTVLFFFPWFFLVFFFSLVFPLLNPFLAMMSSAGYFHARFLLPAFFYFFPTVSVPDLFWCNFLHLVTTAGFVADQLIM